MRKHFLILMLMALLPLAGWADPTLSLAIDGEGITAGQEGYTATYKGAVYAPNITVTWGNEPVTNYTPKWEKKNGNDYEEVNPSAVKDFGEYKLTVTYTPSGYSEKTASVTLTINKVAVTITANNVVKIYGQADPPTYTATLTPAITTGETLDYTVGRAQAYANTTNVGVYNDAIQVTLGNGTVNNNYEITPVAGDLSIGKATVTITAANKTMTYGTNTPTLTYTVAGLVDADGQALPNNYLETAHDGITGLLSLDVVSQQGDIAEYSVDKLKVKDGGYVIAVNLPTAATNYNFAKNDAVLTVKQATMYVKVKNKQITFQEALPTAASYEFEYVSGLMTDGEVEHYVAGGVMGAAFFTNIDAPVITYKQGEEVVATPAAQGTYDVFATGLTAANYKVLINKGTLTINQKDLATATVTVATQYDADPTDAVDMVDYKYLGGAVVEPTVTVNLGGALSAGTDYTVTYVNNTKAFPATDLTALTANQKLFRKVNTDYPTVPEAPQYLPLTDEEITWPYVVISAKEGGNFSGSIKKAFSIEKAPLTITADDKTISLGQTVNYSATIGAQGADLLEANAAAIKTALANKETVEDFTGELAFSCLGGNNVGSFDISVTGLTATNYEITWKKGTLTVGKGSLPLKVKIVGNPTYGTDVTKAANLTFEFDENGEGAALISQVVRDNVVGLIGAENVTYTIKDAQNVTLPVSAGNWGKLAAAGYTVSATAENEDYNITFATATLTVAPKKLTITIVGQEVDLYNETVTPAEMNNLYGENGVVDLQARFYDATNLPTAYDGTNAGYTIKVEGLVNSDQITSLNIDRLTATASTIGTHANAITYQIADGKTANSNYDYDTQIVKGQLKINGLAEDGGQDGVVLTLANVAEKIATYDQQTVAKVTVKFDPTVTVANATQTLGTSEWKAEKWYTMVLPFATTVAKLSKAIGYAIVNVVNPDGTTANNIKFQLTMGNLPANQPFMIKTDADITATKNLVFEDDVKIENATAPSVDAGQGYKLFGTYTSKAITNAHEADYFLFYHSDKDKTTWDNISSAGVTATIKAFNAWADLSPAANAHDVTFTFEELDGSTTAIKAVDFSSNGKAAKSAEGWYTVNGVKLQGAPTEKGIYIQNGKKVVLK